ncbi:ferrochelatase [Campylobacter upsaliensis]
MKLVLFLNMGGACNLKDCELFLKNMFNDPYILGIKNAFLRSFVAFCITKARVGAMRENYKQIGGSSPLNFITTSLCDKLNSRQKDFQFDFVNLYVPPFAKEVLQKYDLKNDDELILFPLYPHHSSTTITTSLEVLHKEIKKQEIKTKLKEVEFFYKDKLYNEMLISHILRANESFMPGYKKSLIFSAHSLPLSVIKKGDLYEKHINAHFELLKESLKDYFDEILLAYQSKLGPVKWLGPSTSEILSMLKNEALIYPLSFCIDCVETIFELEIEYRKIASKDYKVIACPNESEEFMEFILKRLYS